MAQYQHLPIYKVTYDLLVKTTLATAHYRLRHPPAESSTARQSLNSYLGLLRHTAGWRHRQALAKAARAQGLRVNAALTKAIPPTPTAASTLPHLVMA